MGHFITGRRGHEEKWNENTRSEPEGSPGISEKLGVVTSSNK